MSLNKNACDSQNRMVLDKLNRKVPEHTKTTNSVQNNSEKPTLIEQIMALKQIKIHTGTNDIQQEMNTMKMVKKLVKVKN